MNSRNIQGKVIAILIADGFNDYLLNITKLAIEASGASTRVLGVREGRVKANNSSIAIDYTISAAQAKKIDALYIPGGKKSIECLCLQKEALDFVCSVYSAGKNIAIEEEGMQLLESACLNKKLSSLTNNELRANGIFIQTNDIPVIKHFINAIAADYKINDLTENPNEEKIVMPY